MRIFEIEINTDLYPQLHLSACPIVTLLHKKSFRIVKKSFCLTFLRAETLSKYERNAAMRFFWK